MTYAIIETGGKQFRVEVGRFYDVERLAIAENEAVTIERVLFIENDGDVSIGHPVVSGAAVTGTVLWHLRGRKIIVYKMRPKKKTRKKRGHRQELTRLMIDAITLNGTVLASRDTESSVPAPMVRSSTPVEAVVTVETVATEIPSATEASLESNITVEPAIESIAETAPVEEAPAVEVVEVLAASPVDSTEDASSGEEVPLEAIADQPETEAPVPNDVTTEALEESDDTTAAVATSEASSSEDPSETEATADRVDEPDSTASQAVEPTDS